MFNQSFICVLFFNLVFLTVCWMNPINLPPFHQVMVAGGMDPNVEHFIVYLLSLDRGHLSLVMLTEAGPTGNGFYVEEKIHLQIQYAQIFTYHIKRDV